MLDLTNIRTTAAPGIKAPADAVRRRPRHSSVRTSFHLRRLLERLPPPPPPTHSLGQGARSHVSKVRSHVSKVRSHGRSQLWVTSGSAAPAHTTAHADGRWRTPADGRPE